VSVTGGRPRDDFPVAVAWSPHHVNGGADLPCRFRCDTSLRRRPHPVTIDLLCEFSSMRESRRNGYKSEPLGTSLTARREWIGGTRRWISDTELDSGEPEATWGDEVAVAGAEGAEGICRKGGTV